MKRAAVLLAVLFTLPLAAIPTPRRIEPRDVGPSDVRAVPRDGKRIVLRTAIFDPAVERPDFRAVGLAPAGRETEYAIIQFAGDDAAAKSELEQQGVRFFGYVSEHAWQARIPSEKRGAVAASASVRWVGDFEPGFKVHPRLWPARAPKNGAIRLVPFADASAKKAVELLRRDFPALAITNEIDDAGRKLVEVDVPADVIDEFVRRAAAIEGIAWIEPNDPLQLHNFTTSGVIQGNVEGDAGRTLFKHGLTGTGQIAAVTDSGLDDDMCFFRTLNGRDAVTDAAFPDPGEVGPLSPENKVIGYWVQPGAEPYDIQGAQYHGTHTSGTVAGDNFSHPSSGTDAGVDVGDGMAPNARILFQDIGKNNEAGTLASGDPYLLFQQAARGGARVHSNSYGSSTNGAYTAYDQIVDAYLFDHDEMAIVFSAGNDGPTVSTLGSPANAKNVISVGAVQAGISTLAAAFSSRGPTADGRIKPDIMAPGVNISSARGNSTRGDGNCETAPMQGTSMAAPAVAGGTVLVRQYFTDGFYPTGVKTDSDRVRPSATLLKAVLLNGTTPLPAGSTFGDFKFGWGKIFLDNNLYFAGDARKLRVWDLPNAQGLLTGESATYHVNVAAGQEVRATLVWTDPEGTLGAAKALVNDLDLSVTTGAGTYLGNVFTTTGESTTGGSADRLNNVEQVRFSAPAGGTYAITVNAANVPGNGRSESARQGYALVVSAAHCSSAVSAAPQNLTATTNATRGVDLTWNAAAGATSVQVYRAEGSSPAAEDFRFIGTSNGTTFTDRRAQGGYTYTYKVRAADECGEGPVSNAVTFSAAGLCDLAPEFDGLATAQAEGSECLITLSWAAGASNCPLGAVLRYNIYRSTTPGFTPGTTPYATTSSTTYSDTNVTSGTTYYYVVRAEDGTGASPGPNGGNEEANVARLFATAFGPPGTTGTWRDGAGDDGAFLSPDTGWQISSEEAHGGTRSYHNGPDHDSYPPNTCASIMTPPIALDANAELAYFARYSLEWEWDGVLVEISTDGGTTWSDLPPASGYPGTLAETQGDKGTEAPVNACGLLKTTSVFTGPAQNDGLTPWTEYRSSLAAHAGKTVRIRWRFTSDPGLELDGFYLDDISITNAKLPQSCMAVLQKPSADFSLAPGRPAPGHAVAFHDLSTNAPTSWHWSFGDGGTSTQQNPTHTFATAGTFEVSLTATNAAGTSTTTKSVTVKEPSGATGKRRSVRSH